MVGAYLMWYVVAAVFLLCLWAVCKPRIVEDETPKPAAPGLASSRRRIG